jgi:hypothetical protein
MEYTLLAAPGVNLTTPMPFILSVPGGGQEHLNGFSQRLPSSSWVVIVASRPTKAPLLFEGNGSVGDGPWHLHELSKHVLNKYAVKGGRFLMVGVSNGGSSVFRFATLWPELCIGIIAATGVVMVPPPLKLPDGLQPLQGLPIDMYVGTNDECGFYQPMVELDAHLQKVKQSPPATFTVFNGAGHTCSGLINQSELVGKIYLMYCRAGIAPDVMEVGIASLAKKAPRILQHLEVFCEKLDLMWELGARGELQIKPREDESEELPMCSMGSTIFMKAEEPKDELVKQYCTGDAIEVWSNSKKTWVPAEVVRVQNDGEWEGVVVRYNDERGKLTKSISGDMISQFLRKGSGPAYIVGDSVRIYSNSEQTWFDDGEVVDIGTSSLTVKYDNGEKVKRLPLESDIVEQADAGRRRATTQFAGDPLRKLTQATENPLRESMNLKVGQRVEIWSGTDQKWYTDGVIVENPDGATHPPGTAVEYDSVSKGGWVPAIVEGYSDGHYKLDVSPNMIPADKIRLAAYLPGTAVEYDSASKGCWAPAIVVSYSDGHYKLDASPNMIPANKVRHADTRARIQTQTAERSRADTRLGFGPGTSVKTQAPQAQDSVRVQYCGGTKAKTIPMDQVCDYLRPSRESQSPRPHGYSSV